MLDLTKISSINESIKANELVLVIGTGVSLALTEGKNPALSWKGLIRNGLDYGVSKGKINEKQLITYTELLDSSDIDDLFSVAEFLGKKLSSPGGDLYHRWIYNTFEKIDTPDNDMSAAIKSLADVGVPIATLNYDTLVEQVCELTPILLSDLRKTTSWLRGDERGVLHLHGSWQHPESCLLSISDYERAVGEETRDLFQRHLGAFKRLLFVGCGDTFSDPNFTSLISWLRTHMKATTLQHYALVTNDQCCARDKDLAWQGFVEPLGYGDQRESLPQFLLELVDGLAKPKIKATRSRGGSNSTKHHILLAEYRDFLLRDCGEMAIEGIRADMDTARKRFDLEQLFVPLDLQACPPDIPLSDKDRDKKLAYWESKNKKPRKFGEVFSACRGLALLALPGGGKTLLLKRLAVAYSNPERRLQSNDSLPDEDLTPVLIRCREWRDHISLPIPTLLSKLGDITGHSSLAGLGKALVPLLKAGKVLLLVDGLDEIHDDAGRTIFVENLQKFLKMYPSIRLVVTSREAGFDLVAPSLVNYCELWRVAPLSEFAIKLLCRYWHQLMVVNQQTAMAEAAILGNHLTSTEALKRLAENPLLLTMLLVVKHGAGRLPPDRVSLYGRAVELLLDTWNIKGHEALNIKEAVPQLSYVALELMRSGKQTVTEKELLILLERARDSVAQIKRYARDTPYEFLKRVELRSSLLLEAGHQFEGGVAIPFYQFRHLTFQEYLSAVAITDGNYDGFDTRSTVLKPLLSNLSSEEWKEVIPMTAVLAGKQAEPLIAALVKKCEVLKKKYIAGKAFDGKIAWIGGRGLPSDVSCLVQSLAEEAEANSQTITDALSLVAFFAKGCRTSNDWQALACGPYGEELLHHTWLQYKNMDWTMESWVRNTYASIAAYRKPSAYWLSPAGQKEILSLMNDESLERKCLGFMTYVGNLWNDNSVPARMALKFKDIIETHIAHHNQAIVHISIWCWALTRYRAKSSPSVTSAVLDALLKAWFDEDHSLERSLCGMAFSTCIGLPRDAWKPSLSSEDIQKVRDMTSDETPTDAAHFGRMFVGFYSRQVWSDEEFISLAVKNEERTVTSYQWKALSKMLNQIKPGGVDYVKSLQTRG